MTSVIPSTLRFDGPEVPEPSSAILMLGGGALLAAMGRQRARRDDTA